MGDRAGCVVGQDDVERVLQLLGGVGLPRSPEHGWLGRDGGDDGGGRTAECACDLRQSDAGAPRADAQASISDGRSRYRDSGGARPSKGLCATFRIAFHAFSSSAFVFRASGRPAPVSKHAHGNSLVGSRDDSLDPSRFDTFGFSFRPFAHLSFPSSLFVPVA